MKPLCEGCRVIALVSRLARIFVYSLRRMLLIDSGRQLPMCSKSDVPLDRSKDWLAFSFSGTLPGIGHIVYNLSL